MLVGEMFYYYVYKMIIDYEIMMYDLVLNWLMIFVKFIIGVILILG